MKISKSVLEMGSWKRNCFRSNFQQKKKKTMCLEREGSWIIFISFNIRSYNEFKRMGENVKQTQEENCPT